MSEGNDVTLRTDGDWLSKYKVIRILGSGRFGQVHLVSDKSTNVEYAAKQCVCRRLSQRKELEHEIEVMNKLKHEKLIQIFDAYLANKEIILIMELVSGGELFERIADETFNLTEKLAGDYIKQILDGVAYMHQNSILHLDLKPENILCLNPNQLDRIKIIDFGFARKYTPNTPLKVMFGTPEFVAPEIVNFDPLGPETDIWSIGVIAYVLLSGLSPFMGDDDAETLSNVTACDWDFDDECFDEISDAAKNFIERLLVNRKSDRPTCEGCLGLAWLSDSDVTDGPAKTLSGAVTNMKKFVARRKWQRSITAVRAMGRFQSMLKGINNNEEEKPLMAGSSEKPVEAK